MSAEQAAGAAWDALDAALALAPGAQEAMARRCAHASDRTRPVGSFLKGASPFGCLHMAGNVAEFLAAGAHAVGFVNPLFDPADMAAGRFDGFWELKLHPWDVAAGLLIVEEAGGRTSDFSGHPSCASGRETVASNAHLHEAMLEILQR